MEGLIQKEEKVLSSQFLNGLCLPFRENNGFAASHQNCGHGLGHGIMYVNNNELFEAIETCDALGDTGEQKYCWTGVFMENVITDFRDHTTKYLKPEEPMYPCTAVLEKYRESCYGYQSAHVLKITKSFEKTFAACREVPEEYQDACFQSIGRDALIDEFPENLVQTERNCRAGEGKREQKNCASTVVKILISNDHSSAKALDFCSLVSKSVRNFCLDTTESYYKFLMAQK